MTSPNLTKMLLFKSKQIKIFNNFAFSDAASAARVPPADDEKSPCMFVLCWVLGKTFYRQDLLWVSAPPPVISSHPRQY